jgi:methionyl-tRNA formyltransferase
MKDGDLIFLNEMFESCTIKPDAENTFEQTRKMFLEFAKKYKADRRFVQKTLEEIRDGLAKEYAQTNGDESYIHQLMESRRAIDKVLATIAK